MNCGNCRWYDDIPTLLGRCRKNPPVVISLPDGEFMSDFPEVTPDDWCGQGTPTDDFIRQRCSNGKRPLNRT